MITNNNKLRKFFVKEPKYRDSISVNLKETRSYLIISLNNFIDNWCTKHEIHKSSFSEWKQNVLKLVDAKITELSRQPKYNASSILKEYHPSNNLKDLHVLTPIDKATSNAAFICQRFYAQV